MSTFLEAYLDSVAPLPGDIRRNFGVIRELDVQCLEEMATASRSRDSYVNAKKRSGFDTPNSDEEAALLADMATALSRAAKISAEKATLAQLTYELVDKHIRRLDGDLAKFLADLRAKNVELSADALAALPLSARVTLTQPLAPPAVASTRRVSLDGDDDSSSSSGGRRHASAPLQAPRGRPPNNPNHKYHQQYMQYKEAAAAAAAGNGRARKRKAPAGSDAPGAAPPVRAAAPAPLPSAIALDMPVDPAEPRYCLCNRVSFGEMVGCDNPSCPTEWFHFVCVGVTEKPKGKWYCAQCRKK
eukprot:CAMPEP_0170732528 /NCGR_PEP_ID=MMETSP0437-20130122/1604_1 /TAXON_ID=0 /ORGANISM="Sexangularia sp." /LENGTH=300 /DNA_ID=CAMNT_0011070779 /DNA_START=55 /DNA_END=957 /DNA_ORIENTATION=+